MDIDKDLFPWLLRVHAAAGAVALFVAPLAMVVRKGGDWHRRWGRTFFWGMTVVCATAIAMAIIHPDRFWLALVAVFSFHLVGSGYRSLYLKKLHQGQKPEPIDWVLHGVAGLMNGGLLIWGLAHMLLGKSNAGAVLLTVFGLIGTIMVVRNIMRFYRRKNDKREWVFGHISGFLGGYIATVSAFSAVNLTMIQPMWLRWLWPTIVGTPLIVLWVRYYRQKFASGQRMRTLADVRIR